MERIRINNLLDLYSVYVTLKASNLLYVRTMEGIRINIFLVL